MNETVSDVAQEQRSCGTTVKISTFSVEFLIFCIYILPRDLEVPWLHIENFISKTNDGVTVFLMTFYELFMHITRKSSVTPFLIFTKCFL